MHYALPYKTKQFFFVLIKLSIVVGAFYFIYQKLAHNNTFAFSDFISFLSKNKVFSAKNIVFLLLFSFFNWFFEILKWQHLVNPIKTISFKKASAQSLGALTASLFTPNRIGEYGAKAMYYTSNLRKRILLVNLLSNLLQMGVTVLFGILGFSRYILKYDPDLNYYKLSRYAVLLLSGLFLFLLGLKTRPFKIKGFSIDKIKPFFASYAKNKVLLALILSVIRYLIFSFQFYFILTIFQVNLSYLNAMTIISSMYLIASIIPTIFIFDVVIKGSVALYLFSLADVNEVVVLAAITLMWLLNFVIPSLFGSYYVLTFTLPKKRD